MLSGLASCWYCIMTISSNTIFLLQLFFNIMSQINSDSDDDSQLTSSLAIRKRSSPLSSAGSASVRKKVSRPTKHQNITQVIGSKLTPVSTGVSVAGNDRKEFLNKPNCDKAKECDITLSQPDGKAACWKFFHKIDDHTNISKARPKLGLSSKPSYRYAMCNKCGDIVPCSDPKSGHNVTTSLIRHCQKHGFPTKDDEIL